MVVTKQNKYFIYDLQGITNREAKIKFKSHNNNPVYIIHRAYTTQITKFHQGTHVTKTRGEVRGGGKKPWKQKGTGRARAGSNRSPLWRGGGVIFGPKNQQRKKKINKKEKNLALQACLWNRSSNIIVTNNFINNLSKPNTQLILDILKKWGLNNKSKILIITGIKNRNLYLSIRNISNVEVILAKHLNVHSILLTDTIVIDTDAIPIIEQDIKTYDT